jgi:hypothetical protein
MPRTIAAILLIAVLAIGGGLIATTAYQAGLNTAVTTAVAAGGTVVAPVPAYGWGYGMGYGFHPFGAGFGFFGFLGTLLFLVLVFALIRAVFFRGGPGRRGWGPGSGGGPGAWGGPGGHGHSRGRNFWESRFGESFEEWHRQAHEPQSSTEPPAPNTGSKPA